MCKGKSSLCGGGHVAPPAAKDSVPPKTMPMEEDAESAASSSGSNADLYSDDEDVFGQEAAADEVLGSYKMSFLERRRRATLALAAELRSEPLLPLDPNDSKK